MNKKFITSITLVALLVSCGELPTLSEGPRSDENLSLALNEANFVNYIVQSNHKSDALGNYFTVATISPLDLSFKTKTKQLLFTTEHSSYYFEKVENSYDVYYKDKLIANKTYIGNSYYGRYNRTDIIEGIPTLDAIFDYYHVFDVASLDIADFTYNTNLNGWYLLNETAYADVVTNFFNLDNTHTLHHFNIQVSYNKVRSIEYELSDASAQKVKNELFYTYPLDYLQDEQFSLINAVEVKKIIEPLTEVTSETETSTSEPITTSEEPISSEPPTSENPEPSYVDKIEFAIYDDAKTFGANRYTINSIQLFENYNYIESAAINLPIGEVDRGQNETVAFRSITLNRRLIRGNRYLLRINLASSPDGSSSDYYDYSWIY